MSPGCRPVEERPDGVDPGVWAGAEGLTLGGVDTLVELQRDFARKPPGAVLDGRDIGTVIAPDAQVKIFLTASAAERARRRVAELKINPEPADEAVILADIERRDERDRTRTVAPLKPAADAHLLDTTHLDIDAAVRAAIAIVEAARAE